MRRWILRTSSAATMMLALVVPTANGAEFGIAPGGLTIETLDSEGHPDTRAGAHPDRLRITFGLNVEGTGTSAKDFVFEFSPGLASDINAVPTCPRAVFDYQFEECPENTQVGFYSQELQGEKNETPIWNLEPPPGQAAAFGVKPLWTVRMMIAVRPSDYGLTMKVPDLVQFPLGDGSVELWGIPADHQKETSIPRRPFLTMPTRCAPLTVTFRTRSWLVDAPWLTTTASSAPFEGCSSLPFDPDPRISLGTPIVDSPTSMQIDLAMPESGDPEGRARSQIKDVMLQLPDGVTVSPSGADDLEVCSDAQFGLGASTEAVCPRASRIGSVEFASPQSRQPLSGDIYLGEEHPGSRFRMLLTAPGPGIAVKLVSALQVDPASGRLSANLGNLPQMPISHMSMDLLGGAQALLSTPLTCGQSDATARLEPYSGGAPVETTIPISIGAPTGSECGAAPFAPRLDAGSTNPGAGRSTAFSMTLRRQDGEQVPSHFAVELPPGLTGAFGTLQRCGEVAASSGTCTHESRIGQAVAEVGAGPSPAALSGDVFFTGPYRGAPFGLAIAFKAAIGPYDLGTIVTRASIRVDGNNGRVTVRTDPLPRIVDGVPIRFKTIGIDIDRPGLLRNPTSCTPGSVEASIEAQQGTTTAAQSPFALRGCNRLGFRPRFAMTLTGGSELQTGGRPGLSVAVRSRPGNTNLRAMHLALPKLLRFNPSRLREICSRRDAIAGLCSEQAQVGTAQMRTPLFPQALEGPIFVVQPKGNGLPDLWLSLEAMGVRIDLRGRSSREGSRFVTKMTGLPDMPLSTFSIRLPAGRNSVLSLKGKPCVDHEPRQLLAPLAAKGQNGAYRETPVRVESEARCA